MAALRSTVNMTDGADAPLKALREAPTAALVSCHPCDEAIVRHLLAHVSRADCVVLVDAAATPGQLAVSLRFALAI